MRIQTQQPSTIAKTALEKAGSTDTNNPILNLPIPGESMMTVEQSNIISQQDFDEAQARAVPTQEPPAPISEDDYAGFENVTDYIADMRQQAGGEESFITGETYDTPEPVLASAVLRGIQADESVEEEQRERERIKSIPEMFAQALYFGEKPSHSFK